MVVRKAFAYHFDLWFFESISNHSKIALRHFDRSVNFFLVNVFNATPSCGVTRIFF